MTPLITVIVPTIGRPSLGGTLRSLAAQRLAQYIEVLVVADTHNRTVSLGGLDMGPSGPLDVSYFCFNAGYSAWGHPQRNFGMARAKGTWVCSLDDDDEWTLGALDSIVGAVSDNAEGLHVFKMRYAETDAILWSTRDPALGNVGTPMMVWKNNSPVGSWGSRYSGDYDFLSTTIRKMLHGTGDIHWQDHVIASISPSAVPS